MFDPAVVGVTDNSVWWDCPGCKMWHRVPFRDGDVCWDFNGDAVRPTLSPSILTHHTFVDGQPTFTCHCFMRDGKLEFLNDCTHEYAGQTVPMTPWEGWGESLNEGHSGE